MHATGFNPRFRHAGTPVKLIVGPHAVSLALQKKVTLLVRIDGRWMIASPHHIERAKQLLAEGDPLTSFGAFVPSNLALTENPRRRQYIKNPWTPPGAHWPRYELKVEPHERYKDSSGKVIVYKWKITLLAWIPDEIRPRFTEVGFARFEPDAVQVAKEFARGLANKESRNPNDIKVYSSQGRCVWSLRGSC
jgi:hypothetical protein